MPSAEEVQIEYSKNLSDLKINSKPVINLLTMMAEDYIRHGNVVVQEIEKHLVRVRPEVKLPTLYLLDSIIKNVKKDYVELFTQNIVSTFCGVFEKVKVDEKTRSQMFKLRMTWNEVFPLKKLYQIDVRCHQIDGAWPISNPPTPSGVHINPKFIKQGMPISSSSAKAIASLTNQIMEINQSGLLLNNPSPDDSSNSDLMSEAQMREQLLLKQKELLELHQKKLELELLRTKAQLEQQTRSQIDTQQQKQQMQLMQQAEMAKSQTNKAASIIALASSNSNSSSSSHSTPSKKTKQRSPSPEIMMITTHPHPHPNVQNEKLKKHEKDSSSSSKSSRKDRDRERSSNNKEKERSRSKDSEGSSSTKKESKSRHSKDKKEREILREREREREREANKEREIKEREREREVKEREMREREGRERELKEKEIREREAKERSGEGVVGGGNKKKDLADYNSRKDAVLKRNYRKRKVENEEDDVKITEVKSSKRDVDLRFEKDVDLRREQLISKSSERSEGPSPSKKTRSGGGSSNRIEDLFGREDVDLRTSSSTPNCSSWSQVKRPSISDNDNNDRKKLDGHENSIGIDEDEDDRSSITMDLDTDVQEIMLMSRPPHAISPAGSVDSRASCDPLGRPLLYNRLPDDPEERKQSLDKRLSLVDPVEQFRFQYIENSSLRTGDFSKEDMQNVIEKAKFEYDQGLLSSEQLDTIIKELVKMNELNKIQKAQQNQMQMQKFQPNLPNPWTQNEFDNSWQVSNFGPRGDFGAMNRFGLNAWQGQGQGNWGPAPRGPNPFEAIPPMIDDLIPMANEVDLRLAERDTPAAIPLDKVLRHVRFYGETAVVLMGAFCDEPREISFQGGGPQRVVLINNEPVKCQIGIIKYFYLDRKKHSIKLGAPTRELYIDGEHYGACFGGPPVKIQVDGRWHSFRLDGPPPQVEVGKKPRYDLLAGRVNLILEATHNIFVFLDDKPQLIDLCGFPVILRFKDSFNTVTLNGRPFPLHFGGLPMSVTIPGGRKIFFRFGDVSKNVETAMNIYIRVHLHEEANRGRGRGFFNIRGNARGGVNFQRGRGLGGPSLIGFPTPNTNMEFPSAENEKWLNRPGLLPPPDNNSEIPPLKPPFDTNPLDLIADLLTPSEKLNSETNNLMENSYESDSILGDSENMNESNDINLAKEPQTADSLEQQQPLLPLDAKDLLEKLIRAGIIKGNTNTGNSETQSNENPKEEIPKENEVKKEETKMDMDVKAKEEEKAKDKKEPIQPTPPPPPPPVIIEIKWTDLKIKNGALINQISKGVQCSTCGLRFTAEQTLRYSHHLDWHFRQNRREKACSKKAQNRKWYYDLSDWIQFEEVEDLEERAASLFETLDSKTEALDNVRSPQRGSVLNPDSYTVLASEHKEATCPQCGEGFETFFDEDCEEWRLRDALIDDQGELFGNKKLFHPICHQDFLSSLAEEAANSFVLDLQPLESKEAEEVEKVEPEVQKVEEEEDDEDEVMILKEGKKEVVLMEIEIEEDEIVAEAEKETITSDSKTDENISISNNNNTNVNTNSVNSVNNNMLNNVNEKSQNNILVNNTIINNCNDNNDELSNEILQKNGNELSSTIASHSTSNIVNNNVLSPIVVNDESLDEFIPGLADHESNPEGIFQLALLNRSRQGEHSIQGENEEVKRIIYESMKFDFPKIKVEPKSDDEGEEEVARLEDVVTQFQASANIMSGHSSQGETVQVDLTEEDDTVETIDELELDSVDSIGANIDKAAIITEIDGNINFQDQISIMNRPKIRINIAGVDVSGSPGKAADSPSSTTAAEDENKMEVDLPTQKISVIGSGESESASKSESLSFNINVNSNSPLISSNNNKTDNEVINLSNLNSPNPSPSSLESSSTSASSASQKLDTNSEEFLKIHKPRLYGRKLNNCPPKRTGKELSGLCSIC